ncbi:uncharacterized protein BYT42DRAFT_550568 [Radiomyces spectabilis]|uniref:uncharacterized protein n=1 Tax=Radiomyces spectabilis TaxID=64574 RepID=UPI00221E50D1|nr:uncharacterized protein BYT42DRAFT_550568 [Radiomyces spectabilis]KAI8393297.1 hypothetical protein BYT42DRAFT_550568 [Radiomyces spectabilis]
MSATVPLTLDQYHAHVQLYNRFQVLGDRELQPMDTVVDPAFQVPTPHRITAKQLDVLSLAHKNARLRERRKAKHPQLLDAERQLKERSFKLQPHQPKLSNAKRRGGKKLRKEHSQHAVVGMTNEFRSSQTCMGCFGPVIRPNRKAVGAGSKIRSVHGSSLCMNIDCPLYRTGRATQNRDTQAATCIALAGASFLLDGMKLHPFSKNSAMNHMLKKIITTPHTDNTES